MDGVGLVLVYVHLTEFKGLLCFRVVGRGVRRGRDVLACSLSMRPIVKLNVQRDRMGSDQRRRLYWFLNVQNVVAETETCWRQSFPYAAIRNVSG